MGSFPILLLEPVGNTPGAPKGLWRVSWEIPPSPGAGPEPLRYPYLLDLTLDQLMDQPLTSGFVLMTLDQLLDEPTINPFLEKQLEELMAATCTIERHIPGLGPGRTTKSNERFRSSGRPALRSQRPSPLGRPVAASCKLADKLHPKSRNLVIRAAYRGEPASAPELYSRYH